MSDDRLAHEVKLPCVTCGHAQGLHCDHTGSHAENPCGCFGAARIELGELVRPCECTAFVRLADTLPGLENT